MSLWKCVAFMLIGSEAMHHKLLIQPTMKSIIHIMTATSLYGSFEPLTLDTNIHRMFHSPSSIIIAAREGASTVEYKSGKNPYPVDINDPKKGSKKDYNFLKCVSNCKSDCELPGEGRATDRSDCVQDCQDICCETYEQCSYKIKIGSTAGGV